MQETITIPKKEYKKMKEEISILRNSKLYKRLLEFHKNIKENEYTRKDLGF
ncbi:MAG TPA: hypothetical protein VJK05_01315 [archaeon]|nr:hypothetical protein [archaeon]